MGKVTWLPKAALAAIVALILGGAVTAGFVFSHGGQGGVTAAPRVPVLTAPAAGAQAQVRLGKTASAATAPAAPADGHHVVTWAAAPADLGPLPGLGVPAASAPRGVTAGPGGVSAYQTVRDVVHTSVGGWNPRIRLSNVFGTGPVTFDAADVTFQAPEVPGTLGVRGVPEAATVQGAAAAAAESLPELRLTFGGAGQVTIPPGAEALSDPVSGYLPPATTLSVSLHIASGPGSVTGHPDAMQANYLSAPGDFAGMPTTAAWRQVGSWFYLDGIVVTAARHVGTLVTVGDSITDGFQSGMGFDARWPDGLARRILALPASRQLAVANEGLASNRVTVTGVLPGGGHAGQSAEARFDRDVLAQPGVTTVILLEGINDIGDGVVTSSRQLIAADSELIARAHAAGLRILGATLTPFQGAGYYSAAKELIREQLNDWIRTSGAFDGVIDFDQALRDPADPLRLAPAFDSGDHLHPSDVGYQAMADEVNLALLR